MRTIFFSHQCRSILQSHPVESSSRRFSVNSTVYIYIYIYRLWNSFRIETIMDRYAPIRIQEQSELFFGIYKCATRCLCGCGDSPVESGVRIALKAIAGTAWCDFRCSSIVWHTRFDIRQKHKYSNAYNHVLYTMKPFLLYFSVIS